MLKAGSLLKLVPSAYLLMNSLRLLTQGKWAASLYRGRK